MEINVYSPDGITIEFGVSYGSKEEAEIALDSFVKRYERQGYYSTMGRRIPLDELKNHCSVQTTE